MLYVRGRDTGSYIASTLLRHKQAHGTILRSEAPALEETNFRGRQVCGRSHLLVLFMQAL